MIEKPREGPGTQATIQVRSHQTEINKCFLPYRETNGLNQYISRVTDVLSFGSKNGSMKQER